MDGPPPQLFGPQLVPAAYSTHCPVALQVPVVPQVEAAVAAQTPAGSRVPAGPSAQLPSLPGRAHEAQLPQAAAAQQTPSVQWVLMQSVPVAHAAPLGRRLVQEPDWQVSPGMHWSSLVQPARQTCGPHTYGAQVT